MFVLPCVSAQTGDGARGKDGPALKPIVVRLSKPSALPTTLRLPKAYEGPAQLAKLLQAQPPGERFNFAVTDPPPVSAVMALLPHGTVMRGNLITLPNGTSAAIIRAESDRQYAAKFAASTTTKDDLIADLRQLPGPATVSFRRPGGETIVVADGTDNAIRAVDSAPSGTYFTARLSTGPSKGTIYRYPRLK